MLVDDKTYRLEPAADSDSPPRPERQCAWRIRVIDLNLSQPRVHHLKPIVVVAEQTGPLISLTSCAESIGDTIRRDFALDINRVLWVEQAAGRPGRWRVARFKSRPAGARLYYDISWRPIRANEHRILSIYLPEIAKISGEQ